jgi:hypothetical protein
MDSCALQAVGSGLWCAGRRGTSPIVFAPALWERHASLLAQEGAAAAATVPLPTQRQCAAELLRAQALLDLQDLAQLRLGSSSKASLAHCLILEGTALHLDCAVEPLVGEAARAPKRAARGVEVNNARPVMRRRSHLTLPPALPHRPFCCSAGVEGSWRVFVWISQRRAQETQMAAVARKRLASSSEARTLLRDPGMLWAELRAHAMGAEASVMVTMVSDVATVAMSCVVGASATRQSLCVRCARLPACHVMSCRPWT